MSAVTAQLWDERWWHIREDAIRGGFAPSMAAARADHETEEQFGPRPKEIPNG